MNKTIKIGGRSAPRISGFTLIEGMIAVVVIAIISTIAFSSYQDGIIKSKRKAALSALSTIVTQQEEYFVNNKGYSTTLTALGYANAGSTADPYYISDNGDSTTSAKAAYKIAFSAAAATAYTLTATPVNSQAKDTQCGTLSMTSAGSKTISGTASAETCFR